MQQVAEHLSQQAYREAFVRLWVLGLNGATLREWERKRGDTKTFSITKAGFKAAIDSENGFDAESVARNPLAMLQALDEEIATTRALSAPSLRRSNRTAAHYLEDGKRF